MFGIFKRDYALEDRGTSDLFDMAIRELRNPDKEDGLRKAHEILQIVAKRYDMYMADLKPLYTAPAHDKRDDRSNDKNRDQQKKSGGQNRG